MIYPHRMKAEMQGDFVLFLIGMRINRAWQVHRWLPVARAMPRMLTELAQQPELGLLHADAWFGRTIIMLQYWRSLEQLQSYARSKERQHLPAWQAFQRASDGNPAVGIWHECYQITEGSHSNVYVNMPLFGLGKATGDFVLAGKKHQ
jgi:hypothetical protein